MNLANFSADAVGGVFPILAIAWVVRRLMRRKATELSVNITSVLIAAVVGERLINEVGCAERAV